MDVNYQCLIEGSEGRNLWREIVSKPSCIFKLLSLVWLSQRYSAGLISGLEISH